jgi:predicted transcriptional regulator of viral defense system
MKYKVTTPLISKFIQHLHEEGKQFFTFKEAKTFLNYSSKATTKFLKDIKERELVLWIKSGLYSLVPFEESAKDFLPNWHLMASKVVGKTKYYIGYYSALEIHSLITQPALVERIVVEKQIRPSKQTFLDVRFQFIQHNSKHFFGMKKTWIDKHNRILCSDLEKTIIDCLFKPAYAGGIVEIGKALHKAQHKLKYDKLFNYLIQFDSQAVIKRLGFLLELYQIENPIIDKLQEVKSNSVIPLDPSLPKEGRIMSRWNIQINADTETIKNAPHS